MGKAVFNSAVSVRGKVDAWVYRHVKGQVIVSKVPDREDGPEPTEAQLAQRRRFNAANAYAKQVLDDPCRRRVYDALGKERNRRTDRLVVSDFLTPPEVEHIELADYHGQPGDLIRVIAVDDVEVVSVNVALRTTAGTVLEQGAAAKVHGVWEYRATLVAPAGETLTIAATATDRPGHTGTAEVAYP